MRMLFPDESEMHLSRTKLQGTVYFSDQITAHSSRKIYGLSWDVSPRSTRLVSRLNTKAVWVLAGLKRSAQAETQELCTSTRLRGHHWPSGLPIIQHTFQFLDASGLLQQIVVLADDLRHIRWHQLSRHTRTADLGHMW